MRPRTCTPIVLLGLLGIAAASPVLPPSFPKPVQAVYSVRGDVRFPVRIVPHPDLRVLVAEAWELQPVSWSDSFPFIDATEQRADEPDVRYEPAGSKAIRVSEEPLPEYPPFQKVTDPQTGTLVNETYQQWRDRVSPRSLYEIHWREGLLTPGKYELRVSVLTNRHAKVSATRRIEVM